MYNNEFSLRLAQLRNRKGVSARDMSLSIGQNPGYINNIESGKAMPSMTNFFFICEYLNISPKDFFDFDCKNPEKTNNITESLKHLNENQLEIINSIINEFNRK